MGFDAFADLVAQSTPDRALAQRLANIERVLRSLERNVGRVPAFVYQRVWRATDQVLPAAGAALSFTAGRNYGPAMWSAAVPHLLKVPWDGLYLLNATLTYYSVAGGGTGVSQLVILSANGLSAVYGLGQYQPLSAIYESSITISAIRYLNAGMGVYAIAGAVSPAGAGVAATLKAYTGAGNPDQASPNLAVSFLGRPQ